MELKEIKGIIDVMINDPQLSKEAKLDVLSEWKEDVEKSLKETSSKSFFESESEIYSYITAKIVEQKQLKK